MRTEVNILARGAAATLRICHIDFGVHNKSVDFIGERAKRASNFKM